MDAKFTPGPWQIDEGGGIVGPDGRKIVASGIALTAGNSGNAATEANSRLIAAAPTRDALLRRLIAMAEDGFDMRDYDGAQDYDWPALRAEIEATLAEVEGVGE